MARKNLKNRKKTFLSQAPKGTHDILPESHAFFDKIYGKADEILSYYGFSRISTPHFERTSLFTASLGEATDIVEKQMYTFETEGGDSLTLRPEGTAPVMRAYFEHGMHTWPQPVALWYWGAFFRHESPQKGRFREFNQLGLEILGDDSALSDAVAIRVLYIVLRELGIDSVRVHINSIGDKECRSAYRKELTAYYRKRVNYLCKACKRRLKKNPLRLLDCKEPGCVELKAAAPQMIDYLCEGCKTHYKKVLEFLDEAEIPYFLDHYLVRGLDYYSRTVFEIFFDDAPVGAEQTGEDKDAEPRKMLAIGSGGRYDYLGNMIQGKKVFAVGGSLGIERIMDVMRHLNIPSVKRKQPKVFFIQLGEAAKLKSFVVIEELRKAKIPLLQSPTKETLKGQLKIAAKLRVPYALIFGQKEAIDGTIIIRDMATDSQEVLPFKKAIEHIKHK